MDEEDEDDIDVVLDDGTGEEGGEHGGGDLAVDVIVPEEREEYPTHWQDDGLVGAVSALAPGAYARTLHVHSLGNYTFGVKAPRVEKTSVRALVHRVKTSVSICAHLCACCCA